MESLKKNKIVSFCTGERREKKEKQEKKAREILFFRRRVLDGDHIDSVLECIFERFHQDLDKLINHIASSYRQERRVASTFSPDLTQKTAYHIGVLREIQNTMVDRLYQLLKNELMDYLESKDISTTNIPKLISSDIFDYCFNTRSAQHSEAFNLDIDEIIAIWTNLQSLEPGPDAQVSAMFIDFIEKIKCDHDTALNHFRN
ncbi:MAG: hypothetical protein P1U39_09015 [Legionellaceae bacterium]|nr:hypothetical protein [Legionellaceae bacterium]